MLVSKKSIFVTLVVMLCLVFTVACNMDVPTSDTSSSTTSGTSSGSFQPGGAPSGQGGPGGTGTSGSSASDPGSTSGSTTDYDSEGVSDFTLPDRYSEQKSISDVSFDQTIYINLEELTYSTDGETYSDSITSAETTVENITLSYDGTLLSIIPAAKKNVAIHLTGEMEDGSSVYVAPEKKGYSVGLYLDGATINSGNYPCINVDKKCTTYVVLSGTNTLVDGRSYGTGYSSEEGVDYYTSSYDGDTTGLELTTSWAGGNDSKATLYSKGAIIFSGDGSLSVTQNYKHCIATKDYVEIIEGTYDLNSSSGRDGIRTVNGFVMDDGDLTIDVQGTHTNNQSRGIVVEGLDAEEEDGEITSNDYTGEGFILINDGTITIDSVSKAITAKWDIDEDAVSSDTSDDPNPIVVIKGGTISVTTSGTPQDESQTTTSVMDANGVYADETTKLSPEGIEGKQAVYIEGGTILCETTDDCINSSASGTGLVSISGGSVYAHSRSNDCIDSNGKLLVSGGVVVAYTTTAPECAFDCDNYTFAFTGGLVVGIGTNNYSTPTSSACSQNVVVLGSSYFTTGNTAIKDSSGNVVFAYKVPAASDIMVISSPNLEDGTYTIYKNATFGNGSSFNGLYTDLPSVSGGTSLGSFTISSAVTTVGASGNGGPQEGAHPGPRF